MRPPSGSSSRQARVAVICAGACAGAWTFTTPPPNKPIRASTPPDDDRDTSIADLLYGTRGVYIHGFHGLHGTERPASACGREADQESGKMSQMRSDRAHLSTLLIRR